MIAKLLYYIIFLPISLLSYHILYLLSDCFYLIVYKVIRYRRKVILTNLRKSFPNKVDQELEKIIKDFYRHLCDVLFESIKGFTISEAELRKRLKIKNPELTNSFFEKRKDIIIVGGHYNNWEIFGQGFAMHSNHNCIGIYKPLSNRHLNDKIYASRTKYGMNLVSMRQAKRSFQDSSQTKAIVFASDQNPSSPKNAYWLEFLNQDTSVLFGVEKYAKEYNWPVIYVSIKKIKRGYYEAEYSLVTDNPTNQPYGKITEDFTKKLEKDIIKQPAYWLWSHKRWKHKR